MHIKTFSIKGFLILFLLAGLTTFLLISLSFAREPIRTVTGTVTKVDTFLHLRFLGIFSPDDEGF